MEFMGEFAFDTKWSLKDADEYQLHYVRLISPDFENSSKVLRIMARDYHYAGSLEAVTKDTEALGRFQTSVRANLGEVEWSDFLH